MTYETRNDAARPLCLGAALCIGRAGDRLRTNQVHHHRHRRPDRRLLRRRQLRLPAGQRSRRRRAAKGRQNHLRCSAPSTAGSTYNIGQICAGELDFGVAQSDWQYHAFKGDGRQGHGVSRSCAPCSRCTASPTRSSPPRTPASSRGTTSKGKRFNIGNPGSGQRGTTEELMAAHGMDDRRLRGRHRADLDRAVDRAVRRQHRRLRLHGRRSQRRRRGRDRRLRRLHRRP